MIPRYLTLLIVVAIIASALFLSTMGSLSSLTYPTVVAPAAILEETDPAILIGAGDISLCGREGDDRTADLIGGLLAQYPQAEVFTVGDNVQYVGETQEFENCFRPSWGRFKDRIHPSPGNHDWYTRQGGPYFAYFGASAGRKGLGYYSYNLGDWHIVSLNSNCGQGMCDEGSDQARWLREDLSKNANARCTMLYWHHPLWDSGTVPIAEGIQTLWRIASEYGAEVVINGHDHHYERFAPIDWDGRIDYKNGVRPFIVGTGGAWLMELAETPLPQTEVRDNSTFGVIVFKLYPDRYEWEFVPIAGGSFTDSGEGTCN